MRAGWVEIALGALACWRLAAALYYEDGPGDAWFRLRNWAALTWPWLDKQLSCFWCCTFWAALVVWPLVVWLPWLLVPLAISGAAILLSGGGRVIWREMVDHGTR